MTNETQSGTALSPALQQAYEKVNNSIQERKNDLQQRYNELRRIEDKLKETDLHNHYY